MDVKTHRCKLGISQSKLARLSGVSRFRIHTAEFGATVLTPDELDKIHQALQTEAARLRTVADSVELRGVRP